MYRTLLNRTEISVLKSAHNVSANQLRKILCQALKCGLASTRYLDVD
jgi:hypothetical protein